ncbi:putative ADP-ribosylation factor GTPase-activating protein AGD14 [Platanthera zijinensis]|uniref:ADP-ribosylation factor GTPase-activating protein AGD14 n=1 Tax=Platanthera zijinensis TaxID=2320716 RepID=A0AAP0ASK4_9ASPA
MTLVFPLCAIIPSPSKTVHRFIPSCKPQFPIVSSCYLHRSPLIIPTVEPQQQTPHLLSSHPTIPGSSKATPTVVAGFVASREFTHRVKSISMAKFTSQEVNALQEGGNEGERNDYDENRSFKTYRSGARSPPYNDPYEKHFGEKPGSARNDDRNSHFNFEARSPGYDQGDHKSPNRFEMRDEIPRDDKAGNDVQSPKSYKSSTSEELPKPGVSDHQKHVYISSPPMVRPVRDILGSDIPPLRVGELPKTNGGKASNSSSETQARECVKETSLRRVCMTFDRKGGGHGGLVDLDVSMGSEPCHSQVGLNPTNAELIEVSCNAIQPHL